MAIEYANEGSDEAMGESGDSSDAETISIPKSFIANQSVEPGDVVRLEVVSVDEGGIVVKYAQPKKSIGIDEMASKFE